MHVLVTRPEPGASETAHAIEAWGHRATLAPLLEIETRPGAVPDLAPYSALIATSRNALKALVQSPRVEAAKQMPLFAVGQGTGKEARRMGFQNIIEGPAGAEDLAGIISVGWPRDDGPLLHLAGETLAFDLKKELEQEGFSLEVVSVYAARPTAALSDSVLKDIRSGEIDTVILMSPATADNFVRVVRAAGLEAEAKKLTCLCLSAAVAARLKDLDPAKVLVAKRPHSEEMLAIVAALAANSR